MTDLSDVAIRVAGVDDADEIERIYVDSWRGAYAGIVPATYLEEMDRDQAEQAWLQSLSSGQPQVWLAEASTGAVGFASLGPCRDEDADASDLEVYAIYLEPGAWGSGVARRLMLAMLNAVPDGVPVTLWVLEQAQRAQHFCRRHGFRPDGVERRDDIGGQDLTMVRYRRV